MRSWLWRLHWPRRDRYLARHIAFGVAVAVLCAAAIVAVYGHVPGWVSSLVYWYAPVLGFYFVLIRHRRG